MNITIQEISIIIFITDYCISFHEKKLTQWESLYTGLYEAEFAILEDGIKNEIPLSIRNHILGEWFSNQPRATFFDKPLPVCLSIDELHWLHIALKPFLVLKDSGALNEKLNLTLANEYTKTIWKNSNAEITKLHNKTANVKETVASE